jgi:flavin-binding protein dodecin
MMPGAYGLALALAVAVSRVLQPGISSEEDTIAESVYKIIELVGTSPESWEKAASAAVAQAAKSLRDLRVAEVWQLDLALEDARSRAIARRSRSLSSTRITARKIVFAVFPQPLLRGADWQRTNAPRDSPNVSYRL